MPRKKKEEERSPDYGADDIDAMFENAMKEVAADEEKRKDEPPRYNIGTDGKRGVLWPVD